MKKQSINITFIIKGNSTISDLQAKALINGLYKTIKTHTNVHHYEIETYECIIKNVDE